MDFQNADKEVALAVKSQLNRSLPPNASRGQKRLAYILDKIFRTGGADFTIIYEYPLNKMSTPDIVDDYKVNGMAIDFYVKELKMAIEYQGEQHYTTESSFLNSQVERDSRKREFLKDIGIRLVEIPYTVGDNFTEEEIRQRLGL